MSIKVVIKVRFNTSREVFEKFGQGRYIAYLPYPEDNDTPKILSTLISRQTGIPSNRVEFAGKDANGNFVFETI